ncbi:hypothetical protein SUGI_0457390 [Cryptomeria japonica]|uniref:uncharacterized protein LOC131032747 n=1 Tax=Cryptomeria japonica TaxID=3369 RepID=UPI002408BDA6|nr:uncharacterized protein LOC131032747 [Cryptomeria japonica]GLJ24012.1 hypothetical protein SUGI_0457390 [Cryptomeria japonica]
MDGIKSEQKSTMWSRLLRGEQNDDEVDQLLAQFHDENALHLNLNSHITKTPLDLHADKNFVSVDHAGLDKELAMRYAQLKAPPPPSSKKETSGLSKNDNNAPSARNEISRNDDLNKEGRKSSGLEKGSDLALDGKDFKDHDSKARILVDEEEERILGLQLAARFAALKTTSPSGMGKGQGLTEVCSARGLDSQEDKSEVLGSRVQKEEVCSEAEHVQRLLASVQDSIKLEKSRVSGILKDDDDNEGEDDEDEEISDSEVDKVVEWVKDAARLGLLDSEEEDDIEEDRGDGSQEESVGRRSASK